MSIRALYGMPERNMRKSGSVGDIIKSVFGYVDWTHAKLLALSVGAGTGIGWLASKMTEKSESDIDTARAEYQAERAAADIGNMRTKLMRERELAAAGRQDGERAMRLL